ncbi:MAG: hypothetical protein LAP21_13045 [Acidobacteriia bacterium]|nr:hypothetical protein [Terriglobia bacterium]
MVGDKQKPFTAKDAMGAKESQGKPKSKPKKYISKKELFFCFSFASVASFAVKGFCRIAGDFPFRHRSR